MNNCCVGSQSLFPGFGHKLANEQLQRLFPSWWKVVEGGKILESNTIPYLTIISIIGQTQGSMAKLSSFGKVSGLQCYIKSLSKQMEQEVYHVNDLQYCVHNKSHACVELTVHSFGNFLNSARWTTIMLFFLCPFLSGWNRRSTTKITILRPR